MDHLLLDKVSGALRASWSLETSSSPEWSEHNPSLGQCAVTACVIQDYLGGDIVNVYAMNTADERISHYFNVINGEVVDLTKDQFDSDVIFSEPKPKTGEYTTTRDYCLSFPDTRSRYEILASKVANHID